MERIEREWSGTERNGFVDSIQPTLRDWRGVERRGQERRGQEWKGVEWTAEDRTGVQRFLFIYDKFKVYI